MCRWGTVLCALGLSAGCANDESGRGGGGANTFGSIGDPDGSASAGTAGDDDDDAADDDDDDDDDDADDDDDDMVFDVGQAGDEGPEDMEECAEVIEDAVVGAQPADIIFVIDNSQSMGGEIASVQANMNMFSAQIAAADVDPHVIMVSGFEHNSDSGICVPPPLGSGGCPADDHNPPAYWRVGNWVGSHSALARVVQHYPDYADGLRPTASTHVVVISDDNSDWAAATFDGMFKALDPNFDDYRLHAIVNANGTVYHQLAMMTGGIVGQLATNEFQPIFDELASDVVESASLACEYDIPELGAGQEFDSEKVNVEFSDGAGGTLEIGWVGSEAECAGVMDGWYYDDPLTPTKILLCSQTCDAIQGYAMASISIIFGCDTIPAG